MEKLNPHGPPRYFCVLAGGRPVGLPLFPFSLKRPPSPAWAASPQHTHLQAVHLSQPQSSVEASRSSKEATRLIQVRLGVEWGMNLIPCPLLTYHTAQHHSQGQLGEGLMEVTTQLVPATPQMAVSVRRYWEKASGPSETLQDIFLIWPPKKSPLPLPRQPFLLKVNNNW